MVLFSRVKAEDTDEYGMDVNEVTRTIMME